MFKLLIASGLLLSWDASAFILIHKNYRLSKPEKTVFKISSEGCPNNRGNLKKAMKEAVEIWNDVPESRLQIKVGGTSGTALTSNTIPKGEVIIGCGTLSAGTAGVTQPDIANGSAKITLNDSEYGTASAATYGSLLTTVVHEFGHAVGLNHSKDRASVMTYESNGWRNEGPSYLSQDDVDGVIFLYPNKKELGGLLGSCSSYAAEDSAPQPFLFDGILGFIAVLVISAVLGRLLRRLRA